MSAPWFFDRLGIAPVRDAKQIKRAYALALKAIDQQTEREAFETLRKAYEAALAWAREPGYENDYLAPERPVRVAPDGVPDGLHDSAPDVTPDQTPDRTPDQTPSSVPLPAAMSALWFFDRLGIAPVRDAKQIKRAYALALKPIDQRAEPEAAETLRKAYDAALMWASESGEAGDYPALDRSADAAPSRVLPDAAGAGLDGGDARSAPERDTSVPVAPHADPEGHPIDAQAVDPVSDLRGPEPAGDAAAPVPPRPAASTVISNESYGASRVAIRQWVGRLLKPQQTPLEEIFDQALNDPRLMHLDSRVQLEAEIVAALHKDPAGRAYLFKLATDRFGWAERNARPAGTSYQAEWVYGAVNQQLSWEMQPAEILTAQRAAIDAAVATTTPTRRQAFEHNAALQAFSDGFPSWAELVLPAGRVGIWRQAYDNLSEGWLRAARLRQRYPRNFSQFVATLILLIIVGSIVYGMLKPSRVNTPGNAPTSQANAGAGKPPAVEAPVLAYEIMGPVTKDSCETTHEFVHQSNWLEVNDPDAVALLSTRAMLCQDRKLWPQASDPLMDCLRTERGAAFTAGRLESPGACAAKQEVRKPAAGRG